MKNVYVSVLSLLLVTGLNAQKNQKGVSETGPATPAKFEGKIPQKIKTNPIQNKAVIYSEVFSGSAGAWTTSGPDSLLWLFDTDGPNGQFSDPLTEIITSTTAANGFMIFDTDFSNADLGNVQSRTGQLVSPVIDMSVNPMAVITVEHTYRVCCSGLFVPKLELSTDGFATMASYDISSPNAVSGGSGTLATTFTSTVNITGFLDTAVNLTNFQMRFNHDGSEATGISHYFWQVDDITIATPPDNDLSLDVVIWGTTGAWGTVSYSMIPESQKAPVEFMAYVTNQGGMPQDAVFAVSEGSVPFAGTSSPSTLDVLETDGLNTTSNFMIPSGTGTYNFDFAVSSATADANPADNTGSDSLIITDYIYALEHGGPASGGNNGTNAFEIGNIFNIVNDVTLYAADFRVSTLATIGATYYIALYELDTAATTLDSLFKPVYKSDALFVGVTGSWITMPLAVPQNLTGGKAYGLFLVSPGDGFYYSYNGETDPFFNSVFLDMSDTTYYTSNNPAYLRMNFTPPPTITSSDADNMICSPATVTLTSSANSGNVWSTGETTKSITVNATGTYYVSVNGVFSVDVDVVVNTADAITGAVGTNPTACFGNDGKIDVTFGGAGNGTIIWAGTASGSMPGVTATATISNLTAGGYSITYDNGTGCISNAMSVAISDPGAVVPVITAGGATTFCAGGNVDLTSSVTGGNIWSNFETTDAINITTSGFYYAVNNTTPGCVGTSNVIEVVVNALPSVNAGADMTICNGESAFLFGSGAVSYTWDNGVTDGTFVVPTATTTYVVTGIDANTCVNSDTITVTVNPFPTITWGPLSQICVYNAARTLDAIPTGGIYSGMGVSGSAFNPAGLAVGSYNINYEVTVGGCTSTATQAIVVDSCLSINTLDQAQLSIYPNPTTGKFTVSSDNLNQYNVIELRDQLGRTVGTWKINNTIMNIETKNIAKGNYLLVVRGNNGEMMKKIQLMD